MKPLVTSKPHIIITVGIPGSGKSYFAEHFAETFKAPIISTDKLRENMFFNPDFSKNEDTIVNQIANHMLEEVLKTGHTIVYDGRTDLRSERDQIVKKSRAAGYDPMFIWVQTELPTARRRTIKMSRINEDQFNARINRFTNPHPNEKFVVVSGKHAHSSQIRIVLKRLVQPAAVEGQPQLTLIRPARNRNFLIR